MENHKLDGKPKEKLADVLKKKRLLIVRNVILRLFIAID